MHQERFIKAEGNSYKNSVYSGFEFLKKGSK